MFTTQRVYLWMAISSVIAMAAALYLQHYQDLEPCPLCVFQRVAVIAFGIVSLLACLHNRQRLGRRIYAVLAALAGGAGIVVAGRHVWLQHLPADQVPSCGPGLDYWLEALPLQQVINQVFQGSGECAVVDWTLLGLSLPEWTLLMFIGMTAIAVLQLFRR
ncbi:MAG: disulfide bond formation protein B [Paraperlucidibaca sp.]